MKLLNVKEVAELLGVHTNTIYNNINSGQIKAVKKNGTWDISEEEFLKLKREQRLTPRIIIDSTTVVIDILEKELKLKVMELNHYSGLNAFNKFKEYETIIAAKTLLEKIKSTWHTTINENNVDLDDNVNFYVNLNEEEAIEIYNAQQEIEEVEKLLVKAKDALHGKIQKFRD